VTTGKFTLPAKQEAPHCHVELIDGSEFADRLRRAGLIPGLQAPSVPDSSAQKSQPKVDR
jgi:hypothetical protein